MKILIYFTLSVLIFASIIGCKSKVVYVPVESIKTEKEYIDKWHRDSIYVQDSVYFAIKGDTIYKEKYKYIYKDKIVRDSILVSDSIYIDRPIPVDVEVPYYPKWLVWLAIIGVIGSLFTIAPFIKKFF